MQVKKAEELPQTCSKADTEPESSDESDIEVLAIEGTLNLLK